MLYRVGQQLGNYRLLRLLGQGGFAHVYQGEHVLLHTSAAIKLLSVDLERNDRAAFLHEARLLARLDHPHIVRVFDCGIEQETAFLVMEYAPYGTVCDLYAPEEPLDLSTVVDYVHQIAQALQYAHNQGIIHCDIKPTNMLVGRHGELLLSDFGLAVITNQMQMQRKVVGTSAYSAPEQLRGAPLPASDQYSLGVVIYEWLCGERPFYGDHDALLHHHFYASPPPLHERVPSLSPRVEHVIMKALAKIPELRFASIEDFASALEDAASGRKFVPLAPAQPLLQGYAAHEHRGPLVGRIEELERMRAVMQTYEQSIREIWPPRFQTGPLQNSPAKARSHFLLLTGDSGIGKTRLAEEMSREASQQGWAVTWGRASAQETAIPYKLWIDVLRTILSSDLGRELSQTLNAPTLSLIASLLRVGLPDNRGLPWSSETYILPQFAANDPLRLWEAIFNVLIAASTHAALLIVLDDLHLADASSVDFLAYLMRRLHSQNLLVIGTYPASEHTSVSAFAGVLNDLTRERHVATLPIRPLSPEQIEALVADLPQAQRRRIQQQAAGNPLFAEELARAVQEHQGTEASFALPNSIAVVLQQRIARLSLFCQRFLEQLTILGERITHDFIVRMELLDEASLLTLLEEALRAQILVQEVAGPHIYYSFWHPLLRSHLYAQLALARRMSLHLRAANVLRQLFLQPEREGAAIITYHLVAGQADSALIARWATLTADQAYNLCAYPEARQYYNLALTCLENVHNQHVGATITLAELHFQAVLLERLAECAMIAGEWESARRYYHSVLQVRKAFLATSPGEAQLHVLIWCEIGQTFRKSGDTQSALQCYQWAEQLLYRSNIASGPAWARLQLQYSALHWQAGRYEVASTMALRALQECEQVLQQISWPILLMSSLTRTAQTLAANPVDLANAHQMLGTLKLATGELTRAIAHYEVAFTIYEQYGQIRELAYTLSNLANVHMLLQDHTRAQEAFLQAHSLAKRLEDVPLQSVLCYNLGELAERMGVLNEARAWLANSLQLAESFNDDEIIVRSQSLLALVLFKQGETTEPLLRVRCAWSLSRAMKNVPLQGLALVTLGALRLLQARYAVETMASPVKDTTPWPFQERYSPSWLLSRARRHLHYALMLEERRTNALEESLEETGEHEQLDAELKTKARLLLAEAHFLNGDFSLAHQEIQQTQEAASHFLHLRALSKQLSGRLYATLGDVEQAALCFEQALQLLSSHSMPLERAQTLYYYGTSLISTSRSTERDVSRGRAMLQEARVQFTNSQDFFDLRLVDNQLTDLARHTLVRSNGVF